MTSSSTLVCARCARLRRQVTHCAPVINGRSSLGIHRSLAPVSVGKTLGPSSAAALLQAQARAGTHPVASLPDWP